jgi:hypothetical protein
MALTLSDAGGMNDSFLSSDEVNESFTTSGRPLRPSGVHRQPVAALHHRLDDLAAAQ